MPITIPHCNDAISAGLLELKRAARDDNRVEFIFIKKLAKDIESYLSSNLEAVALDMKDCGAPKEDTKFRREGNRLIDNVIRSLVDAAIKYEKIPNKLKKSIDNQILVRSFEEAIISARKAKDEFDNKVFSSDGLDNPLVNYTPVSEVDLLLSEAAELAGNGRPVRSELINAIFVSFERNLTREFNDIRDSYDYQSKPETKRIFETNLEKFRNTLDEVKELFRSYKFKKAADEVIVLKLITKTSRARTTLSHLEEDLSKHLQPKKGTPLYLDI